jgi:ribosomal protein L7/L12/DNA-directed RNA polymerase subunit RPC12/RpoP
MTATFNCPTCGAPLDYPGRGDTMRCPYCNNSVIVPEDLRSPAGQATPAHGSAMFDASSLLQQAEALKEVARLARDGNEIEAIKRYRQITNVGLVEAKDTVENIRAGIPVQVSQTYSQVQTHTDGSITPEQLSEIIRLYKSDQKIEAIKLYRQITNAGLVESKKAVEVMNPDAYQETTPGKKNYLAAIGVGLFFFAIASIFPFAFIPLGLSALHEHAIGAAIGAFFAAGIWALIWGGVGVFLMMTI